MKLKTAIIDDEQHAVETLAYDLMENHGFDIEIIFTSNDPVDGVQKVREFLPDLLFLDINMPRISGLDLMALIPDIPVSVVLTTAHQEYAVEAVGSKAIAYLLKPVQPDDLKKVIDNALLSLDSFTNNVLLKEKIAIHDQGAIELIHHDEIIYCQSDGNYCKLILTDNRRLLASKTLKNIAQDLPAEKFLRVHKSFLVNLLYVKKYLRRGHGELLMSNDEVLPVSRIHHPMVLKLIQNTL